MVGFNYNDYLRICDEINLNKIGSIVEITLILNQLQMSNYNEDICLDKIEELQELSYKVSELKTRAAFHMNYEVYDKCDVYHVDITFQLRRLNDMINK